MRAAWAASQPWWLHLFPRQGSSPLEDLQVHRAKNTEQKGPLCSRSERASESSALSDRRDSLIVSKSKTHFSLVQEIKRKSYENDTKMTSKIIPNPSKVDFETDSLFGLTFYTENDQK